MMTATEATDYLNHIADCWGRNEFDISPKNVSRSAKKIRDISNMLATLDAENQQLKTNQGQIAQ